MFYTCDRILNTCDGTIITCDRKASLCGGVNIMCDSFNSNNVAIFAAILFVKVPKETGVTEIDLRPKSTTEIDPGIEIDLKFNLIDIYLFRCIINNYVVMIY